MKKTFILLYLILSIFICSCDQNRNNQDSHDNNASIIKVNLQDNLNIKDYIRYNSFTVLETTNDNLIGQIGKIIFSQSKIYVLDSFHNCIFIFDEKGAYLSKLNRKGEGSEEYITADDFIVDHLNKRLQIYDGTRGYIINYSYTGDFIDRERAAKGYCLTKLPNENWLFYIGNGFGDQKNDFYNLKLYDKNLNALKSYLPYNKNMSGYKYTVTSTKSVFSEYNDTTYILPLLSDCVYAYNKNTNEIECRYKILFSEGKNSYINENSTQTEVEKFRSSLSSGEIASKIHNFYRMNNMVFFNFFYKKKLFFCLFDEDTGECKCSDKTLFDENGLFFVPSVYRSDQKQKQILSIIDGELFNISKQMDKTNNIIIQQINDSIKTDDTNPILVFYNIINHI
jgi:hypothetical protein